MDEGRGTDDYAEYRKWSSKVRVFLEETLGHEESQRFLKLVVNRDPDSAETHGARLGHLTGLVAKTELLSTNEVMASKSSQPPITAVPTQKVDSRKVFVVHGHDVETGRKARRASWKDWVLNRSSYTNKPAPDAQSLKSSRSTQRMSPLRLYFSPLTTWDLV